MDHEKIIIALGGPSEVARLCEVEPQAVSQWFGTNPKTGIKRTIPKARLMYLMAVRPEVFSAVEGGAAVALPAATLAHAEDPPSVKLLSPQHATSKENRGRPPRERRQGAMDRRVSERSAMQRAARESKQTKE